VVIDSVTAGNASCVQLASNSPLNVDCTVVWAGDGSDARSEASYAIAQFFLNGGSSALVIRCASATNTILLDQATVGIKDVAVAGSAVLTRNAVATSARPQAFSLRAITAPDLRSKLLIAMSSQRPATLTQTAALEPIRQLARKLLVPG